MEAPSRGGLCVGEVGVEDYGGGSGGVGNGFNALL